MKDFNRYYDFMENFTEFYKKVQQAEYDKFESLMSNDIERIQKSMQTYHTYIKQAQQLEHERIELCKDLGFENMAFSEVLRHFSGEEKEKLIEQKNRLTGIVKTIKYLNKKSMDYANMQLSFTADNSAIYNGKGQTDSHLNNSNILDKQI